MLRDWVYIRKIADEYVVPKSLVKYFPNFAHFLSAGGKKSRFKKADLSFMHVAKTECA